MFFAAFSTPRHFVVIKDNSLIFFCLHQMMLRLLLAFVFFLAIFFFRFWLAFPPPPRVSHSKVSHHFVLIIFKHLNKYFPLQLQTSIRNEVLSRPTSLKDGFCVTREMIPICNASANRILTRTFTITTVVIRHAAIQCSKP